LSDLIREVEEDLRRQRLLDLWQRYRVAIVGGLVGVALVAAGVMLWLNFAERERARQSDAFLDALKTAEESGSPEAALAKLQALADAAGGGYRVIARFHEAALLGQSGQWQQAADIYDEIARSGANPLLRDLARIKGGQLLVERLTPDDMRARLAGVLDPSNSWHLAARDIMALSFFAAGDLASSRTEYQFLFTHPLTPPNMRARAQRMLEILGAESVPTDAVGETTRPQAPESVEDAGPEATD